MCNQEVSRFSREKGHCSHAKQRQRNVQKSVLHMQICFLLVRGFYWFVAVIIAVAVYYYTVLFFCFKISS